MRAIEDVIAPAVQAFEPDVIVTQDGADPHHADPLAHLQVTMPTFPRAYRVLHELARSSAAGRWVALGGGGYTFQVVPRAWTLLFAEMLGVELDDEIPEAWWRPGEEMLGVPLPRQDVRRPRARGSGRGADAGRRRGRPRGRRGAGPLPALIPAAAPVPPAIEAVGLRVWRARPDGGRAMLLEGIDWRVAPGERWAVIGPNGAGKTTLMAMVGAVGSSERGVGAHPR